MAADADHLSSGGERAMHKGTLVQGMPSQMAQWSLSQLLVGDIEPMPKPGRTGVHPLPNI